MKSYVLTLYELVLEYKPKTMIEVGVQRGQSTRAIILAMGENNFGTLVSVDQKNREDILDLEYSDYKHRWNFIKGDSTSETTLESVRSKVEEGEYYDMLFIDGGHKQPTVQLDFDNYSKMVKNGGIIMMHDIYNNREEVNETWEKITWEKFGISVGYCTNGSVIPGFGIIKKPL